MNVTIELSEEEAAQLITSLEADRDCFEDCVKHHEDDIEVAGLLGLTNSMLKKIKDAGGRPAIKHNEDGE